MARAMRCTAVALVAIVTGAAAARAPICPPPFFRLVDSSDCTSDCTVYNSLNNMRDRTCVTACPTGTVLVNTACVGEFRLVEDYSGFPSPFLTYGRLEVSIAEDEWGTVCADQATDVNVVRVACRSLGLLAVNSTSFETETTIPPSAVDKRIALRSLMCDGIEDNLHDCGYTTDTTTCTHAQDAYVDCAFNIRLTADDGSDTTDSGVGRLEVNAGFQSGWGTVCATRFSVEDAIVACRHMGHHSTAPAFWTSPATSASRSDRPVALSGLDCDGSEPFLDRCSFDYYHEQGTCPHTRDIYVDCLAAPNPVPVPPSLAPASETEFRLVRSEGSTATATGHEVEWDGAGLTYVGRLETRLAGQTEFQTVCSSGFDVATARFACHWLVRTTNVNPAFHRANHSVGVNIDNAPPPTRLACTGTSAVDNTETVTPMSCSDIDASACTHDDDVILSCAYWQLVYTAPPQRTEVSSIDAINAPFVYRLSLVEPLAGYLEMRSSLSDEWGTACFSTFDDAAAVVACRSAGRPTESPLWRSVPVSNFTSDGMSLADLHCVGNETFLDDCPHNFSTSCSGLDGVQIECAPGWEYRLAGGSATSGRLEVRPNVTVPWGTVCADTFDERAGLVACRALGFAEPTLRHIVISSALDNPVGHGLALQPIWLVDFTCTGNEPNIEMCGEADNNVSAPCSHNQDTILTCSHVPADSPDYHLQLPDDPFRSDGTLTIRPEPACLSFEQAEAETACRSVGYAIDMYAQYTNLDPEAENSTECPPYTNASLRLQCYPLWPKEDATPQYRLEDEERPGRGRVAVQLPTSAQWGSVCSTNFGAVDAAAVCRALGYSGIGAVAFAAPASSAEFLVGNLGCRPSTADASFCPWIENPQRCVHGVHEVGVDCTIADFQFRLLPTGRASRASQADREHYMGSSEGVLQYRPNASASWGPVCYGGFTPTAAVAACRHLYGSQRVVAAFSWTPVTGDPDFTLNDLACRGTFFDTLTNGLCDFTVVNASTSGVCDTAVYLTCSAGADYPVPTELEFRLIENTTDRRGVLQARPKASIQQWGFICGTNPTDHLAALACSALELPTTIATSFEIPVVSTALHAPVYFEYTGLCDNNASTSLTQCLTNYMTPRCGYNNRLAVNCVYVTPAPPPPPESIVPSFRLVSVRGQHGFRFEVQPTPSSQWGTVCSKQWTARDARVACRAAVPSEPSPIAAVLRTFTPVAAEQPIYRKDFACRGFEADPTLCPSSPEPTNCTHDDDLHVICGSGDALGGCSGPHDCQEWALVERNLVPNCPALLVHEAPDDATLDHSECRQLAWQSDIVTSDDDLPDVIPAYVMSDDFRRCAVYRCPLNPTTRRSGEAFALVAIDGGEPTRLYAKLRSLRWYLGLCTRFLSCNGRGDATLETVMDYNASAIRYTPQCVCHCDEGYTEDDCSARPSMNYLPDRVIVKYKTTHGGWFDHEFSLVSNLTARLSEPGLYFSTDPDGCGEDASHTRCLVVIARSYPYDDEHIKRAGISRLLAEKEVIAILLSNLEPGIDIVEIGVPSRNLHRRRSKLLALSSLNDNYPAPSSLSVPLSSIRTFTLLDGVTGYVAYEVARSMRVSVSNAFAAQSVSGSSVSRMQVTSRSFNASCTPITTAPIAEGLPCSYQTYCDFEIPRLPISEDIALYIEGIQQACDGTTPLASGSLDLNVSAVLTVNVSTSLRLADGTSVSRRDEVNLTAAGVGLVAISCCLGLIVTALFVVLMSAVCNCGVARDIGDCRCVAVVFVVLLSYAVCILFTIFWVDSFLLLGLDRPRLAVAFVESYHSPSCSSSDISFAPHHVYVVPADDTCRLAENYGTPTRPVWLRAICAFSGAYLAFGETEADCTAKEDMAMLENRDCNLANDYAPFLSGQYLHVLCEDVLLSDRRVSTVESVMDPVPTPTKAVDVLPRSSGAFRQNDDQHTYFSVGRWTSRTAAFGFYGATSGSSVSLATLPYVEVWAGEAGTSLDVVTDDARETPPAFVAAQVEPTGERARRRPGTAAPAVREATNSSAPQDDAMSAYGPLFNGYDTSQPSSPDRYGAGALRLNDIAGSVFDLGSFDLADHGVTLTFWMRASNATRGYVFLASDAWTDDEGATPIAERLTSVLDNPSRTFFARTWTAYSAIFADGMTRVLKIAYRRPLNLGGEGDVLAFDDPDVVGDLFDDAWHFVAFTIDHDRLRTKVQIFVDGRSSYLGNGYQVCMQEGRSFPAVRNLPAVVNVTNPDTETVREGGIAYVGHLNGGVYAFTVHDEVLTHATIVTQLATASMRVHASIDVSNSRLAGAAFILVFVAGMMLTFAQTYFEFRASREGKINVAGAAPATGNTNEANMAGSTAPKDDAERAHDGPGEVGSNATAGSAVTSQRGLQQLTVVVPAVMQVCQNMTLYFDGMDWPQEFQLTFEWVYFPFSVDIFSFFPSIPMWVALAAQFGLAVLALIFLLQVRAGDSARFDDNVVQNCEENGLEIDRVKTQDELADGVPGLSNEDAAVMLYFNTSDQVDKKEQPAAWNSEDPSEQDSNLAESLANEAIRRRARRQLLAGLPNPQLDMEASKQSVLEFRINGQKVAGLISRVAIQNTITACLREPERPAPTEPSKENDSDTFLAVVLRPEDAVTTLFGFKGLRERTRALFQLASLPLSLVSKLELCGFADIGTVPTRARPLLEIVRDCESLHSISPTERRHLHGEQLAAVVDALNLNYALAAVLPSAAREIVDRCMEMRRSSLVDRLRATHSPDPNVRRKRDRLRQLAERFPMITYYRVNDRLRRSSTKVIAGNVTVQHVLDLVRRPADAFTVLYGLEQAISHTKTNSSVMTLLSAARAAGAPIPNMVGAKAAGATAMEWKYLETIRVLAGCFQAYDENTRALIVQLFFILNPLIAEGSYRTKFTEQRHDLERIAMRARDMFVRRLTEVQTRVDFNYRVLQSAQIVYGFVRPAPTTSRDTRLVPVFYSVDPTNRETYAMPTQLTLEIQEELPRCPVHGLRLIAAVSEVHDLVRQRLLTVADNVYPCAHRNNLVFQLYCSDHEVNKAGEVVVEGCNELDYKVCPDDSCNFSICNSCARNTIGGRVAGFIARRRYLIRRYGLATTLGLLFIVAAQAMYQPAVKGALITLFCHATLLCDFPDCYSPATPTFLALAIGSAVVLLVFGLGLFWMFLSVVWDRKEAILRSSALRNRLKKHSLLPCFDPRPHEPRQNVGVGDMFLVSADAVGYSALLREDTSLFRGLYEQYEFRWMCLHPFTFVFKIAIVCVVLYAGEPNTLRVILLSGLVELVQLVFYIGTEPFTDPWLDIMAKGGSLHQIIQLGLICLYRADTYEDPNKKGLAHAMIFFASAYLLLVLVVLAIVVVIPAMRKFLATRRKREEERERVREMRRKRQEAAQAQQQAKQLGDDTLIPAAKKQAMQYEQAMQYARIKKLKSASESVLRQHFFESDEFSFSLSQPDAYVLAAKGGRLIGDLVASPHDDLTGAAAPVDSPLVSTKGPAKLEPSKCSWSEGGAYSAVLTTSTSVPEQHPVVPPPHRHAVPVESRGTSPAYLEGPSALSGPAFSNRDDVAVQSRGTTPPPFGFAVAAYSINSDNKMSNLTVSHGTSPVDEHLLYGSRPAALASTIPLGDCDFNSIVLVAGPRDDTVVNIAPRHPAISSPNTFGDAAERSWLTAKPRFVTDTVRYLCDLSPRLKSKFQSGGESHSQMPPLSEGAATPRAAGIQPARPFDVSLINTVHTASLDEKGCILHSEFAAHPPVRDDKSSAHAPAFVPHRSRPGTQGASSAASSTSCSESSHGKSSSVTSVASTSNHDDETDGVGLMTNPLLAPLPQSEAAGDSPSHRPQSGAVDGMQPPQGSRTSFSSRAGNIERSRPPEVSTVPSSQPETNDLAAVNPLLTPLPSRGDGDPQSHRPMDTPTQPRLSSDRSTDASRKNSLSNWSNWSEREGNTFALLAPRTPPDHSTVNSAVYDVVPGSVDAAGHNAVSPKGDNPGLHGPENQAIPASLDKGRAD
jgi:hypothetical protein